MYIILRNTFRKYLVLAIVLFSAEGAQAVTMNLKIEGYTSGILNEEQFPAWNGLINPGTPFSGTFSIDDRDIGDINSNPTIGEYENWLPNWLSLGIGDSIIMMNSSIQPAQTIIDNSTGNPASSVSSYSCCGGLITNGIDIFQHGDLMLFMENSAGPSLASDSLSDIASLTDWSGWNGWIQMEVLYPYNDSQLLRNSTINFVIERVALVSEPHSIVLVGLGFAVLGFIALAKVRGHNKGSTIGF
jgi:hypothetical protein